MRPALAFGMSLLLLLLLGGSVSAGEKAPEPDSRETLELLSGETLRGRTVSLSGGKLGFESGGKRREVSLSRVARLVRVEGAVTARMTDGMVLTSGDVIEGAAGSLSRGKLGFESARLGSVTLAAGAVRALFFGQALAGIRARMPAAEKDEVLMVTGSRTPAALRWVDGARIGLASPLGALEVKKADVAWVFRKAGDRPRSAKGAVRLVLTSGETLTAAGLKLAGGKLELSWQGGKASISWALVKRLESAGTGMAYLGELKFSDAGSSATVGPVRKPRVDRCAAGGKMKLGGKVYEQGIGMRARSEISFELAGKWRRLRATVGLDDAAARASRGAEFVVLGDGRELLRIKAGAGRKPVAVDVAVKSVRKLTLVLEAGAGLEIGDYGNWADARLLR